MSHQGATVFVVEDNQAICQLLIEMATSVHLGVETYSSADEFLDKCDPERPGCLVTDIRLPGMNGMELLETLPDHKITLPVIVMSGYGDVPQVVRAMRAGAFDFLEKPFREQHLLEAINAAIVIDARRRQQQTQTRIDNARYATLTLRERQVMRRLVLGRTGKEIAVELGISYKTMEKFRGHVMKKMGVDNVAQLVLVCLDLNLVSATDHVRTTVP